MIKVQSLSKRFGGLSAVDDISFVIRPGEVVGFLGPNGAGKSTTLRMLTGFLAPSSGSIEIDGIDMLLRPTEARARFGYMPETAPLYPEMRVNEYLDFRARAKRITSTERKVSVQKALASARASEVEQRLIGHLSKGFRQRVALADALLGDPPLLILDEPTAGLDPNQVRDVRRLLGDLDERHTVLLSTHVLSEVEAVCDRALVIHQGKLVASGPLEELSTAPKAIKFVVNDPTGATEVLKKHHKVGSIKEVEAAGGVVGLLVTWDEASTSAIEEAVAALSSAGIGVSQVAPERARLEDAFEALTQDEATLSSARRRD